MGHRVVSIISVIFFLRVHDAIAEFVFESFEFHHCAVIELEL